MSSSLAITFNLPSFPGLVLILGVFRCLERLGVFRPFFPPPAASPSGLNILSYPAESSSGTPSSSASSSSSSSLSSSSPPPAPLCLRSGRLVVRTMHTYLSLFLALVGPLPFLPAAWAAAAWAATDPPATSNLPTRRLSRHSFVKAAIGSTAGPFAAFSLSARRRAARLAAADLPSPSLPAPSRMFVPAPSSLAEGFFFPFPVILSPPMERGSTRSFPAMRATRSPTAIWSFGSATRSPPCAPPLAPPEVMS
mmetsp:Transcript_5302/g.15422  ORF Transcript_5302/g.15422 Transcript_5302/m.15422 type:complete len:252 (-) Transcript_5302:929-1684(-)